MGCWHAPIGVVGQSMTQHGTAQHSKVGEIACVDLQNCNILGRDWVSCSISLQDTGRLKGCSG